jgi:hypothetical protein
MSRNLVGCHSSGKVETPSEKARFPFPTVVVNLLFFGALFALASNEQSSLNHGDVEAFGLHAWKLCPDIVMISILRKIERGIDPTEKRLIPAREGVEQLIHFLPEAIKVRSPSRSTLPSYRCHIHPSFEMFTTRISGFHP